MAGEAGKGFLLHCWRDSEWGLLAYLLELGKNPLCVSGGAGNGCSGLDMEPGMNYNDHMRPDWRGCGKGARNGIPEPEDMWLES